MSKNKNSLAKHECARVLNLFFSLVELHEKYMKSFVRADAKIAAKRAQMQAEGTYDETAEEGERSCAMSPVST